jgi:hypothetical protein
MDKKNSLKHLYKDEYVDLQDVYNNDYIGLFFMDLEYVENGNTIKVKEFPLTELYTFEDLDYFQKNWKSHVQQVTKWMDWFQRYVQGMGEPDPKWMRENEEERWENDEIEHDEYDDDFEVYWDQYYESSEYYDEINFQFQHSWDDLKSEMKYEVDIIDSAFRDGWFDSYDRLLTGRMDDALNESDSAVQDVVSDFLISVYDEDDFDEEGLTEHFDEIFE